jgi:hypothetical protein
LKWVAEVFLCPFNVHTLEHATILMDLCVFGRSFRAVIVFWRFADPGDLAPNVCEDDVDRWGVDLVRRIGIRVLFGR